MNTQSTLFPRRGSGVEAGPMQTLVVSPAVMPLTPIEAQDLGQYELKIHDALDAAQRNFRQIGKLLTEIRDRKLYRGRFATFEIYCRERWSMSSRRALQLRNASDVMQNIEDAYEQDEKTDKPAQPDESEPKPPPRRLLPSSESQARPLAALPREEQADAWREAVDAAPAGKLTAKHVQEAVDKRNGAWPKPNANGCFSDVGAERLRFKNKKVEATIVVLQVGPAEWVSRADYDFKGCTDGAGGECGPLMRSPELFATRTDAVANCAKKLRRVCEEKIDQGSCSRVVKAAADQVRGWADLILRNNIYGHPEQPDKAKAKQMILDASQRAVVAIRALQDLLAEQEQNKALCNYAVSRIEMIEARTKTGDKIPTDAEIVWSLRDAMADLGGLDEMLLTHPKGIGLFVRSALAALKPVCDEFRIANARVDRYAARKDNRTETLMPAGLCPKPQCPSNKKNGRPKLSMQAKEAIKAAARAR